MRWYFASRTRHKENLVRLTEYLESLGETVMSDWYLPQNFVSTDVDYETQQSESQLRAEKIIKALRDTDVFVLISDPEGTDMFVELGACLALHEALGNRIYIVGEHSKRSLMQLHPTVQHVQSVGEVLVQEQVSFNTEQLPEFK